MRTPDGPRLAVVGGVAALLAGCGPGRVPTYPATGTVTAGGKPATGVVVTLIPVDPRTLSLTAYPRGEVGSDGRYTLTTFAPNDGAPAGEYKLTLRWPEGRTGKAKALAEAQGEGGGTDRLKAKYSDPAATPWAVTIRAGGNTLDPVTIPEQ